MIILPKLIVAQGPATHHRWPWQLTSETLKLDRVVILLTLEEAKVLKLYFRSIVIFFLLFLHYEPVLGIIQLLVISLWDVHFSIHLQLSIMIHLWMI
jgi:hypothetical protein